MRAAICLSGEPRDFDYIGQDFMLKVRRELSDVFLHCWINTGSTSNLPPLLDKTSEAYGNELRQANTFDYIRSVRPASALLEDFSASLVVHRFKDNIGRDSIERRYSMFYGIQKSCELASAHKTYDAIVRTRPDVFFEHPLDLEDLAERLSADPNQVFIPELYINVGGGLGNATGGYGVWREDGDFAPDFCCVFSPRKLPAFQRIFDDLMAHLPPEGPVENAAGWVSTPEWYLMKWLRHNGLKPRKLGNRMLLARQHRQLHER